MKGKKAKRGKILLWMGLIITLVATILLIVGFVDSITYAVIGGFLVVIGISIAIYGLQLKRQGKTIDIGTLTVKCKNCGFLERDGAEFCSKCGKEM